MSEWTHRLPLAEIAPTMSASQRWRDFLVRDEVLTALGFFAILSAIGMVIQLITIWLASQLLAENATFSQAVRFWLLQFVWGVIATGIALAAVSRMIAAEGSSLIILFLSAVLFELIPVLVMASKIYQLGFLRSVGMLTFTWIMSPVVSAGVGLVVVSTGMGNLEKRVAPFFQIIGNSDFETVSFLWRLNGNDVPDEIARALDDTIRPIGKPKPLPEREAVVRSIQQQLETRRRSLAPDDAAGAARFKELVGRYTHLLNQVKAERAASGTAPALVPEIP